MVILQTCKECVLLLCCAVNDEDEKDHIFFCMETGRVAFDNKKTNKQNNKWCAKKMKITTTKAKTKTFLRMKKQKQK